jgi:hypothetical protein
VLDLVREEQLPVPSGQPGERHGQSGPFFLPQNGVFRSVAGRRVDQPVPVAAGDVLGASRADDQIAGDRESVRAQRAWLEP